MMADIVSTKHISPPERYPMPSVNIRCVGCDSPYAELEDGLVCVLNVAECQICQAAHPVLCDDTRVILNGNILGWTMRIDINGEGHRPHEENWIGYVKRDSRAMQIVRSMLSEAGFISQKDCNSFECIATYWMVRPQALAELERVSQRNRRIEEIGEA